MRIRQQRRRGWLPAAAGIVNYASGGSVAAATWSQAIASTSSAIYVIGAHCGSGTPPITLDIGTGAAASEVVAASVLTGGYAGGDTALPIPVRIPASTRVSLRHTGSWTTDSLVYVPETFGMRRPYLLPGASSTGVAYATTSTTSWVQIIASTSAAIYVTSLYAHSLTSSVGTLDLGIGAVSSEVAIASWTLTQANIGVTQFAIYPLTVPIRIPAATRVAIRGTVTGDKVGISYVNESAVVW